MSDGPGCQAGGDSRMMCGSERTEFCGERCSLSSIWGVVTALLAMGPVVK